MRISLNDSRNQSGFSLFELLVVIAILALTTSVSIEAFKSTSPSFAIKTATEKVKLDLRKTRQAAIKTNRSQRLEFREGGYVIPHENNDVIVPYGVVVELVQSNVWDLIFYADGSSTGGVVMLRKGARRSQIEVNPITGGVRDYP